MRHSKIDEKRRDLARQVHSRTVEELHGEMAAAGVRRAYVLFENGSSRSPIRSCWRRSRPFSSSRATSPSTRPSSSAAKTAFRRSSSPWSTTRGAASLALGPGRAGGSLPDRLVARMGLLNCDGYAMVEHDPIARQVVLHRSRLTQNYGLPP